MKQEFEILMLPNTNPKKGDLILNQGLLKISNDYSILGKEIRERENIKANIEFKHLYILSNEEIKEGDWFYDPIINQILLADNVYVKLIAAAPHLLHKKIVAATDKSLDSYVPGHSPRSHSIKFIPTSFIEKYIKRFNEGKPITKVELETELVNDKLSRVFKRELKCNMNHEVIVVDDIVYSKEEVETLLLILHQNMLNPYNDDLDIYSWMSKNL